MHQRRVWLRVVIIIIIVSVPALVRWPLNLRADVGFDRTGLLLSKFGSGFSYHGWSI